MCGGPNIKPAPAPPVYTDVATDLDIISREAARRRRTGAMNTQASILSAASAFNADGKKTMLGQ